MHFFDVVRNAVEEPLRIHLSFPSMTESVQSQDRSNVGKGRFCRPKSSVVNEPARYRIDLSSHFFGEGFRLCTRRPLKKVHLPEFSFLTLETFRSQIADPAIHLPAAKFDRTLPIHNDIAAVSM